MFDMSVGAGLDWMGRPSSDMAMQSHSFFFTVFDVGNYDGCNDASYTSTSTSEL